MPKKQIAFQLQLKLNLHVAILNPTSCLATVDLRVCYLRAIRTGRQDVDFCNDKTSFTLLNISQNMNCEKSLMKVRKRVIAFKG